MHSRVISVYRTSLVLAALVAISFSSARILFADSFDWRNANGVNWISSIKSQFGGTCWDFSACGTLEAKYMLTRNDTSFQPDVSEQHICWETNPDMGSTGGGWAPLVLSYFTYHGVVSEAECPHQSSSPDAGIGPYWPLAAGWQNRVWKSVSNLNQFTTDRDTMKAYLKSTGPLAVGCLSTNDLYVSVADLKANYRGPVNSEDHEVVLVGYYDDAQVPTGGYWVIKNSWGAGAGDKGYYYVPYGNLEIHNDTSAITGAVYYTGSMATAVWNGGTGNWGANGSNWNSGGYAWENKETSATFAGTGGTVAISGSVIAHGVTVNSAGYSFTGGSLTTTAGGITANESVTINSSVTIGAPQTWTIAGGRTLTVSGPIHTNISDLTIAGVGDATLSSPIDGGGVLNSLGAAPGRLIKSSAGALKFTGAGNTVVNMALNSGTTIFAPPAGVTAAFSGAISGGGTIVKTDAGTTVFSGVNTYTSATTISAGALQADSGVGLPTASALVLDGGVIQSNGNSTIRRYLGAGGSNTLKWTTNGGGFSAGGGTLTVQLNNGATTVPLSWGSSSSDSGTKILGTLKFGSSTAASVVDFQNYINLDGAAGFTSRTIQVDDNATAAGDYSKMSGVISNGGSVACGIQKTGAGLLVLTGVNTYDGPTTVSAGALQADFGVGIPGLLRLDGGVLQSSITNASPATFNYSLGAAPGTFQWTANGGGFAAGGGPLTVNINGGTSTVAWGTTVGSNIVGTLTFGSSTANNAVTLQNGISLAGDIRTIQVDDNLSSTADKAVISGAIVDGSGTGGITKIGAGLLALSATNSYSGPTTISDGVLQADDGVGLPAGSLLLLDGGILQTATATTFNRGLSAVQWTANGGGFSSANGPLTVNIGGGGATLDWGAGVGNGIMGTLKLGTPTSTNTLTFQNGINLYGGQRTIEVGGTATLTGVVGDGVGGGSLIKSGSGTLILPVANTFAGDLTIRGGTLLGTVLGAFGPSSSTRTITVNAGGTLKFGVGNFFGAYTATSVPTIDIQGGTVTGLAGAQAFNNLVFNGGTLLAATDAGTPGSGGWGSWNLNGAVTSRGTSAISATDSNASVTLQNGDVANPSTTFDVVDGALTVSVPIYNGIDGHTTGGSYLLHSTALVKTGAGTLTLSAVNRYSGVTTIAGGVISTSSLAAGGVNCGIGSNASLVLDGGGLLYTGTANVTFNRSIALGANGGTLGSSGGVLTYNGVISGTGAFGYQGNGKLILSGATAIAYPGATTVAGGKLVLAKSSGYAVPGDLTIANANTTVVLQNANQLPSTAVLTFSGLGSPTLELYGHSVTVGGLGGHGTVENTEAESGVGNGALIVNNAVDYTFGGSLRNSNGGSGVLSLTKNGGGVLTLTGANTGMYTGGLTVNAGTLDYSGGALPSCNYTITGGTLNIGSHSQSIGAFQMVGGTVSGSGTLTSSSPYDVQSGVVDAVLAGTFVGLNKTTSGSATLNSPTYAGNTVVRAGRLTFTGGLAPGNLIVAGGTVDIGSLSPTIRGFGITAGTITGSGAITVTGSFAIYGGQTDVALAGASSALKKTATQTAILNGANTYGGRTTVAAGTLQLGPAAQNAVFNLGGADIQLGRIAFDFAGADDPAATILGLLTDSYHGGLWDVGKFQDSTAASTGLTLGWFDDGSSAVTVMATYAGDFNLDGVADVADLDIWTANAGRSATWQTGDANYDGTVNLLDLDLWKANFGLPAVASSASGAGAPDVPEPGTLALLATGLLGLLATVWRKRR